MAAGPLQEHGHVGGDGVQVVAVGDLVHVAPVDLVEVAADDPAVLLPGLFRIGLAQAHHLFIAGGVHQVDTPLEGGVKEHVQMGVGEAGQHQPALQVDLFGVGIRQGQNLLVGAQAEDHPVLHRHGADLGIGLVQRADDAVVENSVHTVPPSHCRVWLSKPFFTIRPS